MYIERIKVAAETVNEIVVRAHQILKVERTALRVKNGLPFEERPQIIRQIPDPLFRFH